MTTPTRRLGAAATAAAALACAACSTKLATTTAPSTTAAPTTTVPGAATPAQTKAAVYRARLTYLMVEHVFLLARVTGELVAAAPAATPTSTAAPASAAGSTAPTSAPTASAAGPVATADDAGAALDGNSHDIADALAQVPAYGGAFGPAFYTAWTARVDDIAAYATAKAAKDTPAAQQAVAALKKNATDIATIVHRVNNYVAVTTVATTGLADELSSRNDAVTSFVDAQAGNSSSTVGDIVNAAELMRHTAEVLAAAASKLDPVTLSGTATGTGADLRASVTSALVEHVELAALTAHQLVAGKPAGADGAALDANTGQLANVVIVNFGDDAARMFTAVWGGYTSALEADARAKRATTNLSAVGAQVGNFFAQQAPQQLSASTIGADTQRLIDALGALIGAAATGTQEVTQARVAAADAPKLASDLAEGIAEGKPTQYLP